MRAALLASVLCLAACSGAYPSYVGPIDPAAAPQLAADMTTFVSTRIKPSSGTVEIEHPAGDQSIGPLLATDLEGSGFRIVNMNGKHRVRYAASAVGTDIMAHQRRPCRRCQAL